MITGSGRESGSTGGVGVGTGAVARDSSAALSVPRNQLRGMSEQGMNDPAYRIAYQECMKRRGF